MTLTGGGSQVTRRFTYRTRRHMCRSDMLIAIARETITVRMKSENVGAVQGCISSVQYCVVLNHTFRVVRQRHHRQSHPAEAARRDRRFACLQHRSGAAPPQGPVSSALNTRCSCASFLAQCHAGRTARRVLNSCCLPSDARAPGPHSGPLLRQCGLASRNLTQD